MVVETAPAFGTAAFSCKKRRGKDRPHVLARNTAKNSVQTFALSRFRRIEATGHMFTRPKDFDLQAYVREAFGITGGEKPLKVRLLFAPKIKTYITERQ